jgi:hypothetical protein
MSDKKISKLSEKFENEKTGEQFKGITNIMESLVEFQVITLF